MKWKTRFNLGKGLNYMKWKVSSKESTTYYNFEDTCLLLTNCKLLNNSKSSKLIYEGHTKFPCAWIKSSQVHSNIPISILESIIDYDNEITYNPKVSPNWVLNNENVDNKLFKAIVSKNKKLYLTNI